MSIIHFEGAKHVKTTENIFVVLTIKILVKYEICACETNQLELVISTNLFTQCANFKKAGATP